MDYVNITCYGRTERMNRQDAINLYADGVMCCDGSERERYAIILSGLVSGLTDVSDEI